MAKSRCENSIHCYGDPACQDRDCRGHPCNRVSAADLAAGQRALHVEDGGSWITTGHRVLRLRPEPPAKPRPCSTSDLIGRVVLTAAGALAILLTAASVLHVPSPF